MFKIQNNIDKLIAFNPVLDPNFRKSQRISTPSSQLEVLDIVENFQKEGWEIDSAQSFKDKRGRYNSSLIKFENKNINFNENNNLGGFINSYLNVDYNNYKTDLSLGMKRMICDNSMVVNEDYYSTKCNLSTMNNEDLDEILYELNISTNNVIDEIYQFQNLELNNLQKEKLSKIALQSRFGINSKNFNVNQLLVTNRKEDKGNEAWKIFNTIQENIIKPNKITDNKGRLISEVLHPKVEKELNQKLFAGLNRVSQLQLN
jgi:hypothetical protein